MTNFKCNGEDGNKYDITWKNINEAFVAAITVCNQKLNSVLIDSSKKISTIIIGAIPNDGSWLDDIKFKLESTNLFKKIDTFDATNDTPIFDQIKNYNTLMVFGDNDFDDENNLGDIIADFVDSGGGVVITVFSTAAVGIGGRWQSGNYDPITVDDQNNQDEELTLGEILVPNNPIVKGITSFNGGTSSYYGIGEVTENTTIIAEWSNGYPLIVEKHGFNGKIIALNFYPPSSDVRNDFWDSGTQGALIMGQALKYVS